MITCNEFKLILFFHSFVDDHTCLVATFSILAGLRDIGLLDNIRYVGGTSAGALAVLIFCYAQNVDIDRIFTGEMVGPREITIEGLNKLNEESALHLATKPHNFEAATRFSFLGEKGKAWIDHIAQIYLHPFGIKPNKLFSWNEETVRDILSRNTTANMSKSDFLLPRLHNGPFMVINWTMIGPKRALLDRTYDSNEHDFRMFDITPLYVGQMATARSRFNDKSEITIGGIIEPFAFGSGSFPPIHGLGLNRQGLLTAHKPLQSLDLVNVAATSHFKVAKITASHPLLEHTIDWSYDYYSPVLDSPKVIPCSFCDGGKLQSNGIIPFIQRGVEKIVYVITSRYEIDFDLLRDYDSPLNWNQTQVIPEDRIDESLSAMFGITL